MISALQAKLAAAGIPHWRSGDVLLVNHDSLVVLPLIEPGTVDAVVTDAPYGINHAHHSETERRLVRPIAGDEDQAAGIEALSWAAEHNLPTIAFASPKAPWPGEWRGYLVWDKGPAVGGGGDTRTCLKQTWELIQVARNGPIQGPRDGAVITHWVTPAISETHPSAKPVPLMERLVLTHSNPGDLVVDVFCGRGTTGVAALMHGRRFRGCEVKPELAAEANQRCVEAAEKASAV